VIRHRPLRQPRIPLPDALLSLAASLQDAGGRDQALDRLTDELAARDVACALLLESGESLLLERATLPLSPTVWGRPLRLSWLSSTLQRSRPSLQREVEQVFREAGSSRSLLTERAAGPLIAAPFAMGEQRGILCLAGRELDERIVPAVWALALQVGSALRSRGNGSKPASAESGDLSIFDDLTRRLSYSLGGEGLVQAALEVLAPALDLQCAAAVSCRGSEDLTIVYARGELDPGAASATAAGALDAFIKLTGDKHRGHTRPPFQIARLAVNGAAAVTGGKPTSVLDAPLVLEGGVRGLLRVVSSQQGAFDAARTRLFFTVANQISLALERIDAQQKAGRAQLASLAESLDDGIALVDQSLRLTSLNRPAKEQIASLLSRGVREGDSLADTPLAELVQATLSTQKPTERREFPGGVTPGGRRNLVVTAAPLAGSPEGSAAVIVLRDMTEERLMQERLLQSEKMVSVGQLVSGVAHELNNPLTGIMGFAQLLLQRGLDETTKRDMETIYSEAERAAKIVQNLVSFARRRRSEKELVNLNSLLERVLELRNYDLRVKNIDLELDLDDKLPDTMVDANQLQQVFLNVIINAEQAMLAARGEGKLTVQTRRHNNGIRISFHDDGPGMEPETRRRVFDPFFTTKDPGEGTGLGLTISYGIIEEHGGQLTVESQPGRGSTFIIELPVVQGRESPRTNEVEQPQSTVTPRSILVVDDEASIQRLLGSILELDGHQVETARNGREALERIGRHRYDVIITDIKMPDMDGRELYQRLLNLDPSLAHRTIFITGDIVSPDTRSFLQGVNNPCLTKPFRVREVRDTISEILAEGS
jgi:two-component system, NtrC family, sensor kinase